MKSIRTIFVILFMIHAATTPCLAEWSQEDRDLEREQLNLWKNNLQKTSGLDRTKKIEILALGIRSLGYRRTLPDRDPETDQIYKEVEEQLLSTPGHAEFFRDKIKNAQSRLIDPGGGSTWSDYAKEQMFGFQTFPYLQSPEGVRVLGEMLSDDWVPPTNEKAVLSDRLSALSNAATGTLNKFPIEQKPFSGRVTTSRLEEAKAAWRQWHEQVKAGNRTYRFEGDPTEYDLNGPASARKLERIAKVRERDGKRATGREEKSATTGTVTTTKPDGSATQGITIALLVGISALLAFVIMKRKTASRP